MVRKRTSIPFFVSGQAQHLENKMSARRVEKRKILLEGQGPRKPLQLRSVQTRFRKVTYGFKPSGLRGLMRGLIASALESGSGGTVIADGEVSEVLEEEAEEDEDEEENGHISIV